MGLPFNEVLASNARILNSKASRVSVQAVIVAIASVIVATLLVSYAGNDAITLDGIAHAQRDNFVLWILDALPFVFGYIGQYTSYVMSQEASQMVLEQTEELRLYANRMEKQVGKNFDWIVVPDPCGPAACTGMPGGAAFVALKRTKSPKEVGRFLDFFASEPIYAEYMAKTVNIPANAAMAKKGLDYNVSPPAKAAMTAFVGEVGKLSPVAYELQGYKYNRAIFNPTAQRLGQAIAGEMSLDDALKRIAADIDEQVKAAAK
jgi:ABC-type glycerol-3-phosphate transport system substrate-binding protein